MAAQSVHARPDSVIAFPRSFEESELIAGIIEGNEYAWMEFHARYRNLIIRCISRIASRFSNMLCEEDLREIYGSLILQLMENNMYKVRCFDPNRGCKFSTWIGMLAVNACYDHLRVLRREPSFTCLSEAASLSCDRPDPLAQLERKHQQQTIAELFRSFSKRDQQFIRLYFHQGLDADQVAKRLGISVKTVYSKKHKIRLRLEQMLHRDAAA